MASTPQDYAACVELICKMNVPNSPEFEEFQKVNGQPEAFQAWLISQGIPKDIATSAAHSAAPNLYTIVGEAVCLRFW